GGYSLLRGKRVELKANQRLPEKVASGKDIKQAAFDSIRDSLTGPEKGPTPEAGTEGIGARQDSRAASLGASETIAPDFKSEGGEKVPTPIQPSVSSTLAPPPGALAPGRHPAESIHQQGAGTPAQPLRAAASAQASAFVPKTALAQSIRFSPSPKTM